jgi:hypothetical protein
VKVLVLALALAACKLPHKYRADATSTAPVATVEPPEAAPIIVDAAPEPITDAAPDGDDEAPALVGVQTDAGCPQALHPFYCRFRCKDFIERKSAGHAERISPSAGHAFGTCGAFDVFAENDTKGGGIVEYYDAKTGVLVGAIDRRRTPCPSFGVIPSCTMKLAWADAGAKSLPDLFQRKQ